MSGTEEDGHVRALEKCTFQRKGKVDVLQRPGRAPENRDPTEPQCLVSAEVEKTHFQGAIWPELSPDRSDPSDFPVWSFRWHPVHMLTSGARVAFGTRSFVSSSFVAFGASSLSLLTIASAAVSLTPDHRAARGRAGLPGGRWAGPSQCARGRSGSPSTRQDRQQED